MIKVLPIAITSFYVIVGFANATKNRPEMGNEDYPILKQDNAASSLSMISSEELADFSLGGSLSQLVGYLPEPAPAPEPEPEPQPSGKSGKGSKGNSEPEPEPKSGKGSNGTKAIKKSCVCGSGKSGKSGEPEPQPKKKDNRILKQDNAASSLSMISSEELADFSLGGSLSQLVGYLPEPAPAPEPEPEPQPSGKSGKGSKGNSEPEPEPKSGKGSNGTKAIKKSCELVCGSGKSGKSGESEPEPE